MCWGPVLVVVAVDGVGVVDGLPVGVLAILAVAAVAVEVGDIEPAAGIAVVGIAVGLAAFGAVVGASVRAPVFVGGDAIDDEGFALRAGDAKTRENAMRHRGRRGRIGRSRGRGVSQGVWTWAECITKYRDCAGGRENGNARG